MMLFSQNQPSAVARIRGNALHPLLRGAAYFYQTTEGTVVEIELCGLPHATRTGAANLYALHIYTNGHGADPLETEGALYNPQACPYPACAGNLPPLFGNRGCAWAAFYTERFRLMDVLSRFIVVHAGRDDFTTPPVGGAGPVIGCGRIEMR